MLELKIVSLKFLPLKKKIQGVPGAVHSISNVDSKHQNKKEKSFLTWVLNPATAYLKVNKSCVLHEIRSFDQIIREKRQ